jgi:hypothetical protein
MGLAQLYGQIPSYLSRVRPKKNWAKVDCKEFGQHWPKTRVGPM